MSSNNKTILSVIFAVIVLLMVMVIVVVTTIPNASGSQIAVLNLTKSHILAVNGTIVQNATVSPPSASAMEPRILANGTVVQNITGYLGVPTTVQLCPDTDYDGKCGIEKGQLNVNRCPDNDHNYICDKQTQTNNDKNDYDNSKDSIRLKENPNCNPDITNMPCYDVEDTRQEAGYGSMEGPYTENCDRVPCTEKEKQEFIDAGEKWPEQIYDEEHGKGYLYE